MNVIYRIWQELAIIIVGGVLWLSFPDTGTLGKISFAILSLGILGCICRIISLWNKTKQSWLARFYRGLDIFLHSFLVGMFHSLWVYSKLHVILVGAVLIVFAAGYFLPLIGVILASMTIVFLVIYSVVLLHTNSQLNSVLVGAAMSQELKHHKNRETFAHEQNLCSYQVIWYTLLLIVILAILFQGIAQAFPQCGWYSSTAAQASLGSWIIFAFEEVMLAGIMTFDILEKYGLRFSNISCVSSEAIAFVLFFRFAVSVFLLKVLMDELLLQFVTRRHVRAMERIVSYVQRRDNNSFKILEQLKNLANYALADGLYSRSPGTLIGCYSLLSPKYQKQLVHFVKSAQKSSHQVEGDVLGAALISLAKMKYTGIVELVLGALPNMKNCPEITGIIFENLPQKTRKSAIKALQELGLEDYADQVMEAMEQSSAEDFAEPTAQPRQIAEEPSEQQPAKKRGSMELKDYGPQLIKVLATDEDVSIRAKAAYTIGSLGLKECREQLLEAMENDPDEEVRVAAANALQQLEESQGPQEGFPIQAISEAEPELELGPVVAEAIPQLESELEIQADPEPQLQLSAEPEPNLELQPQAVVVDEDLELEDDKLLLHKLRNPDANMRIEAVNSIAEKGLQEYAPQLAELMVDDANEEVRELSEQTLDELGMIALKNNYLLKYAHSSEMRKTTVKAVAALRIKDCYEQLAQLIIEDPNSQVREAAVQAIAKVALAEYASYLQDALNDPEEIVRVAAHNALKQMEF